MKKVFTILLVLSMMLVLANISFAEDPVTLQLWHRWSGNNEKVLAEVVAAFEADHPEVNIEITAKPGEYFELLQQMIADIAAGNPPPDIFVGGYNLLNYIATEVKPTPVDQMAPDEAAYTELKDRFLQEVFALGSYGGVQVGVPFAMSNMIMYVNLDIFEAAGLTAADVPTTWEGVAEKSKVIKEKTGKYGIGIQLPDNWADQALIYSAGGNLLSEDGTKVAFNDEGGVRAYTMWQNMVKNGFHPVATDPEILASFQAGEIAMHTTTIMKLSTISNAAAFKVGIFECPSFEGYPKQLPAGGAALISFAKDQAKKDAAWKFFDYAVSPAGMTIFVKTGYLCVTKAEVPVLPGQEASYAQRVYARPWACWPGGAAGLEIEQRFLQVRTELIYGDQDVKTTLDELASECNDLL
jgi:multiple sugar transport system substrate-binding protein